MSRDYRKEKEFVKSIAEKLKLSINGNRAGAVLFSSTAELRIKLSDFSSAKSFNEVVDQLPLLAGTTRIDTALRTAFNDLFSQENGMRAGASKLLIVLTDGKQSRDKDYTPLHDAIVPFHETGIKVIVIGIGDNVEKDELSRLVYEQSDLFLAKDFEELVSKSFIENITLDSCTASGLSTQ